MRLPLGIKDLAVANAFDGCLDKVERALGALEKIAYSRLKLDSPDSALGDIQIDKRLAGLVRLIEGFDEQVFDIEELHPLVL